MELGVDDGLAEVDGDDLDEDSDDLDSDEFDDDEELGTFEFKNKNYAIIKVGMPLLLIAKAVPFEDDPEDLEYILLEGEENENISLIIQSELDKQFNIQAE